MQPSTKYRLGAICKKSLVHYKKWKFIFFSPHLPVFFCNLLTVLRMTLRLVAFNFFIFAMSSPFNKVSHEGGGEGPSLPAALYTYEDYYLSAPWNHYYALYQSGKFWKDLSNFFILARVVRPSAHMSVRYTTEHLRYNQCFFFLHILHNRRYFCNLPSKVFHIW